MYVVYYLGYDYTVPTEQRRGVLAQYNTEEEAKKGAKAHSEAWAKDSLGRRYGPAKIGGLGTFDGAYFLYSTIERGPQYTGGYREGEINYCESEKWTG